MVFPDSFFILTWRRTIHLVFSWRQSHLMVFLWTIWLRTLLKYFSNYLRKVGSYAKITNFESYNRKYLHGWMTQCVIWARVTDMALCGIVSNSAEWSSEDIQRCSVSWLCPTALGSGSFNWFYIVYNKQEWKEWRIYFVCNIEEW